MNLKRGKWKAYLAFILLSEAVGALAGFLTRDGMKAYAAVEKSPLTPPDAVFPIVWSVLYLLMGIGAARVYLARRSRARSRGLTAFFVQLAMNFTWTLVFFNFQAFGPAFVWLVLLFAVVTAMAVWFARVDRPAGLIQLPYMLWLAFAGYLNCVVWLLNR